MRHPGVGVSIVGIGAGLGTYVVQSAGLDLPTWALIAIGALAGVLLVGGIALEVMSDSPTSGPSQDVEAGRDATVSGRDTYEAGRDIHITQGTPPTSQPLAGQPSTSFDRARQLVRASGSAALGGGEERSEALLARAKEIDAQNPAITIAIARQTEDPDEVMDMLAGVEPVDDTQAALLELTRAGAESARQNIQAAKGHVAAARELHPDSPMVEEVGANIVLFAALGGLPDDVAPDRSELAGVGEKLRRRAGLEFADLLNGRSDRSPDRASPGRGPPAPRTWTSMTGQC